MSLRFAVVHEAGPDFEIATQLADRVLCEAIDWMDEDLIVHQRAWLNESTNGQRLTWTAIKHLALEANITVEGHFDGVPALADAKAARRAIVYLRQEFPELDAIVLIRDQDDQPDRRGGLEQARNQDHGNLEIVVGLAIVERECWVLAGYDPGNEAESARLEAKRQSFGFDPREKSHELTACKDDAAKRSPKRVLRSLSEGNGERERRCWFDTPLPTLRLRGLDNGLADYLDDVQSRLSPLFGHAA